MQEIRFGTDGVRGAYGEWPLTAEGAQRIGYAVGMWAQQGTVVVGRDTRQSSPLLSDALCDGLIEAGATALDGGVLPTAAVSCAVAAVEAAAGVMITASHNPWMDNGVKILNASGRKPTQHEMATLEERFQETPTHHQQGRRAMLDDAAQAWRSQMPTVDLSGMRILVDCAHGAAAPHAPQLLESMGATVLRRGCMPDGTNINSGVGALHPPKDLNGCDLAICLDGDADRLSMVLPKRGVLDGDDMLWIAAQRIPGPVVGTVMTNGGLESALNGRLHRAAVGDQNVAALMRSVNANVGAEPSGHILFSDGLPTGDGLYAALRILSGHIVDSKLMLPISGWTRLPTVQTNVRFTGPRRPLETLTQPQAARQAGARVIVRYSGTEPKLRILVEGSDAAAWADRITDEFLEA